jgi:hypothetical protein
MESSSDNERNVLAIEREEAGGIKEAEPSSHVNQINAAVRLQLEYRTLHTLHIFQH